jgi:DNA-binding MarR family transcriptional regulator
MDAFDLNDFLPYQLAVAAAHVSRGFAELYRAEFGLSIPEWRVLAHLAQSGTVSVREIQARVDMDKSKVSRAAARLEAAGLIAKRAHGVDRRLLDMSLTPAGRDLMARIVPIAKAYEARVLARVAGAGDFRAALRAVMGPENPVDSEN